MRLVRRTLEALEVLGAHAEGLGVTRLGELLGEPPSSVHRLLAVLVATGYVTRDERRYRLGFKVLRLGQAYQRRNELVAVGKPHIGDLSARTLESVFLSELIGDDTICVASAESPRPLSFYMRLGERTPYHAASSARAILAFQPDAVQIRLMQQEQLERFTTRTPITVAEALAEVQRTAVRGYAICDQEMEYGITALSAPIRDAEGLVSASVTLVAPQDRLVGAHRETVAAMLLTTAAAISTDLGHRTPVARLVAPPALAIPAALP
jgi:DNA-binding IclR family transcriptional regulator